MGMPLFANGLQNASPNGNILFQRSNPIAAYRNGLNTATWANAQGTQHYSNPESITKMNPSLWSQARGILPNMIVIPSLNMNQVEGAYFVTPNGMPVQRAGIQVSFLQSTQR